MDVGTSTTQVIFSELLLENTGGFYSVPQIAITRKRILYRSPIHPTPLLDECRIDAPALRAIVTEEFRRAGMERVQTGAVIITGESARKENAAAVLEGLSGLAGDFVAAVAGPDLESLIAGQGSGAQALSKERRCRTANFDIGGGTTNIAVFENGEPSGVCCLDIGGRQLRFGPRGELTYLSPSAARLCEAIGLSLPVGQVPAMSALRQLAACMARLLEEAVRPGTGGMLELVRTRGSSTLPPPAPGSLIPVFSGGVADCIYKSGRDPFAFGDFGVLLGEAVRAGGLYANAFRARETIRATVIGAGMYTASLSGSTVSYSRKELFPLKNLPVFSVSPRQQDELFDGVWEETARAYQWFLGQNDAQNAIVWLEGRQNPGYLELRRLAAALAELFRAALPAGQPWLVLTYYDAAKALGLLLQPSGAPVIALDGLRAAPHQFIDLGQPVMHGLAVPVVIKTLMLNGSR